MPVFRAIQRCKKRHTFIYKVIFSSFLLRGEIEDKVIKLLLSYDIILRLILEVNDLHTIPFVEQPDEEIWDSRGTVLELLNEGPTYLGVLSAMKSRTKQ